jgi:glycerophosphoryl diester phosphodiesterase
VNANGNAWFAGEGVATIYASAQDGSNRKGTITVESGEIYRDSARFIAHRGLSAEAPENSKPAFRLAAERGFWGVEFDVWETSPDGSGDTALMISHDESLLRMTGIDELLTGMTYDQVKYDLRITGGNNAKSYNSRDLDIPSLEEALDVLMPYPNVHAVIELKQEYGMSGKGLAYLENAVKSRGMEGRTVIASFGKTALRQIRERTNLQGVELMLIMNRPENIPWADLIALRVGAVAVEYTQMTADALAQIHAYGMKAGVYTVDDRTAAFSFIHGAKYGGNKADYMTTNVTLW